MVLFSVHYKSLVNWVQQAAAQLEEFRFNRKKKIEGIIHLMEQLISNSYTLYLPHTLKPISDVNIIWKLIIK